MQLKKWICLSLAALTAAPAGLLAAPQSPAREALDRTAFEIGRLNPQGEDAPLYAKRRASEDEDVVEDAAEEEVDNSDLKRRSERAVKRNRSRRGRGSARGPREHHPLVGLVVAGGVLAVAGLVLTYDGFRHNPVPSGTATVSGFYYYGYGGYNYDLDPYGTVSNDGNCSTNAVTIRINVKDAFSSNLGSLTYTKNIALLSGESTSWSDTRTDVYNWGGTPNSMSVASTSWYSDGSYAMNNVWEGTGGLICIVAGVVCLVIGLTHTQEAMADNGIDLKLQRADADHVTLAASKTF
jgi:hypothetical protein